MWIQVRAMDGTKSVRIDGLSKLTKIEELRSRIKPEFDVEESCQRLFYRGKQLEDGHTLFDYNVGLNEIIQLLPRKVPVVSAKPPTESANSSSNSEEDERSESGSASNSVPEEPETVDDLPDGALFKVNDEVDARDMRVGAWFEGKVKRVKLEAVDETGNAEQQMQIVYHVHIDGYDEFEILKLTKEFIRRRAHKRIPIEKLRVGEHVVVNYNTDQPTERGYWYDAEVVRKNHDGLFVRLLLGSDVDAMEECKIVITDVYEIPREGDDQNENGEGRENMPDCRWCKDNPRRKCKHCACVVCGEKKEPEKQILCDECDDAYHLWCLEPALDDIPDTDEWYCPQCKNDDSEVIKAGEGLRHSKKKAKMASKIRESNRDWGRGMACVGRTKICTIVPQNHFGAIPGVPVGSQWKFRMQASEAGVHRPHVSGIHGRDSEGAYSIVLAGGYEDDQDDGEVFTYTGSGGRDLSGNKRTAQQSCDQTLTKMNRALARNCAVSLSEKGASAKNWKDGKPVRVLRSWKGRKHSKYAPEEGVRYDGLYKVVKYWPQKGKSNFLVWRYELRRDDTAPAPWTKGGQAISKKLGLVIQYPEGYLENLAEKEKAKAGQGKKRKHSEDEAGSSGEVGAPSKKMVYKLAHDDLSLIKADKANEKLWQGLLADKKEGFLDRVQETFCCICCQELVYQPVTTVCSHNVCKGCLQRSFKAKVFNCPACRGDLNRKMSLEVNDELGKILISLFPGYCAGR